MKIGYIYVISSQSFGPNNYKLGQSYNDGKKLESRYNTYSVEKMKIEASFLVEDKLAAEKQLFNRLKDYRIDEKKEFFSCELSMIISACEEVQQ